MRKSSKPNDWKILADSQAKAKTLQDFQEKSLSRFSKDFYRSQIHAQIQEKNEQKYNEALEKQQHLFAMTNTLKHEQTLKLSESQQTLTVKKNYLNDCLNQLESKMTKAEDNFNKNRELERSILRYNRLSEESYKALQSLKKSQRISSFQQYIAQKSLEKNVKTEELKVEKFKDQELVNDSIERFNKNQVEYRQKLKSIEERQRGYQKVYLEVQKIDSNKFRSKSELVRKWECDKKTEIDAKEAVHLEAQQKLKKAQGKGIRSQINEKLEQQKWEKLQKSQEKEYSDLTVIKEQLMKKQEKVNELEFKNYYKKTLRYQICEKEEERFNENTLNEREKQVNKEIIEKFQRGEEIEFKGVPGMHRTQSALKNCLLRDKFTGNFSSPSKVLRTETNEFSPVKTRPPSEQSFYSNVSSDKKHDPILNPIGSCRKLDSSFQRGRGISSLFN